jgi:hypothetical protein
MNEQNGQPLNDEVKAKLTEDINTAVQACLEKPYSSKDDAIDAVIADLEALKDGPAMGALGGSEEKMDLGEAEGEGEEEQ